MILVSSTLVGDGSYLSVKVKSVYYTDPVDREELVVKGLRR